MILNLFHTQDIGCQLSHMKVKQYLDSTWERERMRSSKYSRYYIQQNLGALIIVDEIELGLHAEAQVVY